MAALGEGPSTALDSTFGALLIGVFFAIFFQGLLTVQAYNYFENFPEDRLILKFLVLLVWILDTIHLIVICKTVYHYLVTNWGYQPALEASIPELLIHIVLIGLASFSCQVFFLFRIWVFSDRSKVVCGFVLAICVATLVLNIHLPLLIIFDHFSVPQLANRKPEVAALFLSGALSDILIACLLCYYLRFNDRRSNHQATRSVVGTILQYVVATGLMTSALGIAAVIAFFIRPSYLYYIAIHLLLGRLYTTSLLATLNSRTKIRETLHNRDGAGGPHKLDSPRSRKKVNAIPFNQASDLHFVVERATYQGPFVRSDDIELKSRSDILTSVPH